MQFKALVFKFLVPIFLLLFTRDMKLYAQASNDSIYLQSLYDSSKVYYTDGNYTKAIESLHKILTLKKKSNIDSEPQYFKVYNRLGLVYKKNGILKKAIEVYNLALNYTSVDFNKTIINGNIANIYSLLGEYSKAISYLDNSLSILENSNSPDKMLEIADNYHNQGYAYYQSGQYELALQKSLKGMQLAKENKQKINGSSYSNLGLIYKDLDSLEKADFYFKKAIKTYENEYGKNRYMTAMAYLSYAVFYAETGQFEKGEKLFGKSYKILIETLGFKHYYTFLCLKNTGDLFYKKEHYIKALQCYQQALTAKIHEFNDSCIYQNPAKEVYPDLDLLDVLNAKAKALEKLAGNENKEKNLTAALQTLQLSVGFIEQLRTGYLYESSKLQLAETEHKVYLSIVRIAYTLYQSTKNRYYAQIAFKYAELSKYGVLRELQNDDMAKQLAGIPKNMIEKEYRLKEEIGSIRMQVAGESMKENPGREKIETLNSRLFMASNELENIKQGFEKNYPDYYRKKYDNKVIDIEELQQSVSEKDAVVEYVLENNMLYTFIVTKDTFNFSGQAIDSTFHHHLEKYTTLLRGEYSTVYSEYKASGYALYKVLIKPFEPFLESKNLIIIPDGSLNLLSFEALPINEYKKGRKYDYYINEMYLLKKFTISYCFSSTIFAEGIKRGSKNRHRFLGIAPDYKNSKDSLFDIPEALRSVRKIAWITIGKSLTGDNATESQFKEICKNFDIIHFYAHGFEDTLVPGNSKLYLSNTADTLNDGYLHAWEINNLRLNAKLVVLGSCYSGSGRNSKGEGVLSLSRSFANAGSESVIMSLWLASSIPTDKILTQFYKNLLSGMRKDKALQQAKLKYIAEASPVYADPKYWSGIVLNGTPLPLYKHWLLKKAFILIGIVIFLIVLFKYRKSIVNLF